MILYLSDGTTTVHLQGSTAYITGCTYFPATPESNATTTTDRVDLILRGTTPQIRTAVRSIEFLLDAARRRRATGVGPRVFRYYAPLDTDTAWRSEIYDGRVVWSDEPALRRLTTGGSTPITAAAALILERAPFEEGPETELAISSNANPTPTTGGVAVVNDPASGNWIQIAADQVGGALPAPLRVRFTNTDSVARAYSNFYVGVNAGGGVWAQALQGESALSGGTVVNNASYSGGQYLSVPLTVGMTSVVQWRVPAAMLAGGGRFFRLLANISLFPDTLTITPVVREYYGLVELWRGQETALRGASVLHDLGAVPMPPLANATDAARVVVEFRMRASATGTAIIDYVALLGADAFRRVRMVGMNTLPNDYIEIDEIESRYTQVEAVGRHPLLAPLGTALMAWPNTINRIHFIFDTSSGNAPIGHTASVRCWHRPRRPTV